MAGSACERYKPNAPATVGSAHAPVACPESGFRPIRWRRILDERVPVEGDDGPVTTTLSDHYGVEVTLALEM